MNGHEMTPRSSDAWLTRREAAEIAGVALRTIDRHLSRGTLPAARRPRSRQVRIALTDFEHWNRTEPR